MSSTRKGQRGEALDVFLTPEWVVRADAFELDYIATRLRRQIQSAPFFGRSSVLSRSDVLTVLEPCAGDGAIVRGLAAVLTVPFRVVAIEVRQSPVLRERWTQLSARAARGDLGLCQNVTLITGNFFECVSHPALAAVDLITTNPPFSMAQEFISTSRSRWPNAWNSWLLRLNFLGSEERHEWLQKETVQARVLPNRPSFVTQTRLKTDKKTGKQRLVTTQSDSIEYAWMTFGRGWGLHLLPTTPAGVRRAENAQSKGTVDELIKGML